MNILRFPPISHAVAGLSAKQKNASVKASRANKPARIAAALSLLGIVVSFMPAVWADREAQPGENDKTTIAYAVSGIAPAAAPAVSAGSSVVKAKLDSAADSRPGLSLATATPEGKPIDVALSPFKEGNATSITVISKPILLSFWDNFRSNLFMPLLLFFYLGFAISLLKIAFEFPQPIYQGLTIALLISIGWHGGEELSAPTGGTMTQALAFMAIGFLTNIVVLMLQRFRRSAVPTLLGRS